MISSSADEDAHKFGRRALRLPWVVTQEANPAEFNRNVIRGKVLDRTLSSLGTEARRKEYLSKAHENVQRWQSERQEYGHPESAAICKIEVVEEDSLEAAQTGSKQYGEVFAVMNMANPVLLGGNYREGSAAQEENLYRRTDCHFSMAYQASGCVTDGGITRLGRTPRICICGPENRADTENLGYEQLSDDEIFLFYELRSAAPDCRFFKFEWNDPTSNTPQYFEGSREDFTREVLAPLWEKNIELDVAAAFVRNEPCDREELKRRIIAQFNSLEESNIEHAVLGAFGCGAFANPPETVAAVYREVISERMEAGTFQFKCLKFAIIFSKPNLDAFKDAMRTF